MAFKIQLADAAVQDISEFADRIALNSVVEARKWVEGLFREIETLRELPHRYALIPEAGQLKRELRSIHHHSHRVIYEVHDTENTVYIARVYHGARKPITKKDVG